MDIDLDALDDDFDLTNEATPVEAAVSAAEDAPDLDLDTDDEPEVVTKPKTPETKEAVPVKEVEAEDEDEDEPDVEKGLIHDLQTQFGFDFGDAKFENSEKGVMELARAAAQMMADQTKEKYKAANPQAHQYLEFLENGGDSSTYINASASSADYLSYSGVPEEDEQFQEDLVLDELEDRGITGQRATDLVERYRAGGVLHVQAEMALESLQDTQTSVVNTLAETQRQTADQQRVQHDQITTAFREKIKISSEFSGIPLPEKDKEAFTTFAIPDANGNSGYAQKVNKGLTDEQVLTIQLLAYYDFDLSKVIENRARTKKAQTLEERLQKTTRSATSSQNSGRRSKSATTEDIDFDADS